MQFCMRILQGLSSSHCGRALRDQDVAVSARLLFMLQVTLALAHLDVAAVGVHSLAVYRLARAMTQ